MTLLTPIDAVAQQDAMKAIDLHKQYHGGNKQAIDIGANIGNYSKHFAKYFQKVITNSKKFRQVSGRLPGSF